MITHTYVCISAHTHTHTSKGPTRYIYIYIHIETYIPSDRSALFLRGKSWSSQPDKIKKQTKKHSFCTYIFIDTNESIHVYA